MPMHYIVTLFIIKTTLTVNNINCVRLIYSFGRETPNEKDEFVSRYGPTFNIFSSLFTFYEGVHHPRKIGWTSIFKSPISFISFRENYLTNYLL